MDVDDETVHAGIQEMIHRVSDDGAAADLQKRFRAALGQRPEPRPQSGRQNERRLKSPFRQWHLFLTTESQRAQRTILSGESGDADSPEAFWLSAEKIPGRQKMFCLSVFADRQKIYFSVSSVSPW
jgi:hypothetical protein